MEKMKTYLISRFLMAVGGAVALDLILLLPVRGILLPLAARAAEFASEGGRLSFSDIATILWSALFGSGQKAVLGILARSQTLLLLMLSAVLLLLPFVGAALLYAHLAAQKLDAIDRERAAEREAFEAQRNLMLSDFAHDLRTPMTTIGGYAEALSEGMVKDPETQKEYLEAIHRKSQRLTELINMLFAYVRLGSAGYSLTREACDMNALTAEVAAGLYTDVEEAGDTLLAEIPEEPFMADADRVQISRVLNNLIVNAMRHNPSGTTICVDVRRLAGVEKIAVADTGVRIEKDPKALFEPFVRGDDARAGDGGSGLGLSISKKIADMHGWDLSLVQPYGPYTKAFVLTAQET